MAVSPKRYGSAREKTEQPEFKLEATVDSVGITEYYQQPFDRQEIRRYLAQLRSSNELISECKLTDIRISRLPGQHMRTELKYTASAEELSMMPLPEKPVFQLACDVIQEPIQAHHKFRTQIGGTPQSPLNGAKFDQKGFFEGWESGSIFAGVEKYDVYLPRWIMIEKSKSRPQLTRLGRIDTPEGGAPGYAGKWLFSNVSYTVQGSVYTTAREWTGLGTMQEEASRIIYG
jgi:hypothetical protein